MCKRNGKSVNNLLLHCEVASALWNVFFSKFGLSWIMPRRVVDLYARLLWCLWRERNDKSFENFLQNFVSLDIYFCFSFGD